MHITIFIVYAKIDLDHIEISWSRTKKDDGIRQNESKTVFIGDWGFGFVQEPPADMTCFYRLVPRLDFEEPSTSRRMPRFARADRKGIALLYSGG